MIQHQSSQGAVSFETLTSIFRMIIPKFMEPGQRTLCSGWATGLTIQVSITDRGKRFVFLFRNVHTKHGAHPTSYSVGIAMSRTISVLPLYVFMTLIAAILIPNIWFGRQMQHAWRRWLGIQFGSLLILSSRRHPRVTDYKSCSSRRCTAVFTRTTLFPYMHCEREFAVRCVSGDQRCLHASPINSTEFCSFGRGRSTISILSILYTFVTLYMI